METTISRQFYSLGHKRQRPKSNLAKQWVIQNVGHNFPLRFAMLPAKGFQK